MRRSARLPPEELAPWLLESSEPPPPLDWPTVFGNRNPVEIEIGFGKGLFLLTAARARPDVNFLGVEIERKYQLVAATRLAKHGVANVRLVKTDARSFLRDAVPVASVQALHVYFPDPWWKKRHHKRRVFTPAFAARCEQVLRPGGRLYVATDVSEVFSRIQEAVGATRLTALQASEPSAPTHDLDYLTHFERKFRKAGKPIYRAAYKKPEPESG